METDPRAPTLPAGTTYEFGPFRVNVDSLQLIKEQRQVALAPKTFDTLVLLLRNRHRSSPRTNCSR